MPHRGSYLWNLRQKVGHDHVLMPGASVLVLHEQDRVLLTRRTDSDVWCMPGGAAEIGSSFASTAISELREETGLIAKEEDASTKAVLEKRQDVLQRRYDFVGKIGKILTNLNHQLQLLEDTFGLINDEVRARSPEQILADIDEVVVATDSMSSALEELAPYEQLTARVA